MTGPADSATIGAMNSVRPLWSLILALALVSGARVAHAKPDPKQAKVNVYIDVLNAWSGYVYKQRDDYFAWVDRAKGPDCKASKARGPSAIGDTARDQTFPGYLKALKKGPKLPADEAAMKMVTTLQALWQPTADASEYYFKRQWKDDDCQKGKALHETLTALWDEYAAADREVRAFVVAYNDERQVAELATTAKKYGKKLRFHFLQTSHDAKLLIRTIDAATEKQPYDTAAVTEKLTAFVAILDATTALAEAQRNNRKVYDVLYQGGYTQFVTHAGWYRDAVAELAKLLADPKAKPERLGKAHDEVIRTYNAMVDAGNKVQLTKSIK